MSAVDIVETIGVSRLVYFKTDVIFKVKWYRRSRGGPLEVSTECSIHSDSTIQHSIIGCNAEIAPNHALLSRR